MKKKEYFFEGTVPFEKPELKVGFRITKKLYSGRSPFQKIDVLEFAKYGAALILDDIVQTTVNDEFIYHEMLCQAPLFVHPAPKKVLIIGGGDGGSLEEVLKHKGVKEVWMVEIDKKVVDVARKYLPSISKNAFDDKRTHLLFEDGKKFVRKHRDEFDVVILDLSDPGGPAQQLISEGFYKDVRRSLKKGGIVSVQSASLTTQAALVRLIKKRLRKLFRHAVVRTTVVPSYQAGLYSFTMASDFAFPRVRKRALERKYGKASFMNLRYWSPAVHEATAVLPAYLAAELK